MPLFGNKNTTTTTGASTGTGPNVLHRNDPAQGGTGNATGHNGHTGPGPALGAVAGGAAGHYEGHTAVGTALGALAGHHHAKTHPDVNHNPNVAPGVTGQGYPTAGTGAGVGTGAGMGAGTGAGAVGTGMGTGTGPSAGRAGAGASEKAIVGKLEHAAGTVLCSSTLKAKGLEKERESQALNVQASEIRQAESLEAQGQAGRERAVAHGAHPHHLNGGAGAGVEPGARIGGAGGGGVGTAQGRV